MSNKRREPRSPEAIVISGYATLYAEAPEICGVGYGKLKRMLKEERLETFGTPEKVDVQHLFNQARNDFPLVVNKDSAA